MTSILVVLLCAAVPEASQAGSPLDRLTVEVTYEHAIFRDLDQVHTVNPAIQLTGASGLTGWHVRWHEYRALATFSYPIVDLDWLELRPVAHVGTTTAEFKAVNRGAGVVEKWRTHTGFVWGVGGRAEVRAARDSGPFVRAGYETLFSEATEDAEVLTGARLDEQYRKARFRWRDGELWFGAGWRLGPLVPMVGVSRTWFRLRKWLDYRMPTAGLGGRELEIAQAQNSEASRFRYNNEHPWSLFASVELKPTDHLSVAFRANLTNDEDYRIAVAWRF